MSHTSKTQPLRLRRQRGVALYVVLVMVLLSMLLALWAARSALFSQLVVGNDADYRRTFQAAQAMLQDAEFDIRGTRPDGSVCHADPAHGDVCRRSTSVYLDIEKKDLEGTLAAIGAQNSTVQCYMGLCQKRPDPQDFWNDDATLAEMIKSGVGARYGQFTGADSASTANPTLSTTDAGKGAWYWIEILPYIDSNVSLLAGLPAGANVDRFAPARDKPWIYRITALARGNKPHTQVVLRSTLSVQRADN